MKWKSNPDAGRWLGQLAFAALTMTTTLTALPAAAQFDLAAPPPRASASACDAALCGASGLSTQALSDVARSESPKSLPAASRQAVVRDELRRSEPPRDPWNRHIPVRPDVESYDCILSLGVGGELSKGGFLGTRVLGQTQVWRQPDENLKP
ncbi:hypothetical protein [Rugamonas sp.]|uniref:hypothetical protein n=1 Tax=Rugamonas sp. TaxID=1926287 RepID=UPI0025DF60E6|nr:hypothetical protein [Rugamonas sp.]